jgi:hypothetical protein
MAGPNASVFNMSNFTVTRRVAKCYIDDVIVPINEGEAKGEINSWNFLTGIDAAVDGINSGVEQIIIKGAQIEEIRGWHTAKVTLNREIHIVGSLKTLVDKKEERVVKVSRSARIGPVKAPVPETPGSVENLMVQGQRSSYINGVDHLHVNAQSIKTTLLGELWNTVTRHFRTGNSYVESFWWRHAFAIYNGITCGIRTRSSPIEMKFFVLKHESGIYEDKNATAQVQKGIAWLVVKIAKFVTGGVKNWFPPAP